MKLSDLSRKSGVDPMSIKAVFEKVGSTRLSKIDVVKMTGVPEASVKKIKEGAGNLFLPIENFFVLSDEGKAFSDLINRAPLGLTDAEKAKITEFYERTQGGRPKPERKYDQFYTDAETQLKRMDLISKTVDISESRFLVLGDDDLTSLCLSSLAKTDEIAVCEIDPGLITFLTGVVSREKLQVEMVHADIREGLPANLARRFDVVFTDPPYTPNGFDLFLDRAVEALDPNSFGTIIICYGTSRGSYERILPIQESITKKGLVVVYSQEGFNTYRSGAESVGNRSGIYVLKTTPKTKFDRKKVNDRVYTYE